MTLRGCRAENVLPKSGAIDMALVDARRQGSVHALETEHANVVLVQDAIAGLQQALARQFVSDPELNRALDLTKA